ncbi:MAG: hypothetical protein ACON4R_00455 [Akkermansiaceae bacterium]
MALQLRSRFLGAVVLFTSVGESFSQDPGSGVSLPSGFARQRAVVDASSSSKSSEGGLDFSLRLDTFYDSNALEASGEGGSEIESDIIFTPALSATYLTGNRRWKLGVDFDLSRDEYLDLGDLSATEYALRGYGSYTSKKLQASLSAGFSQGAGINRRAGVFLEQFSYDSQLSARYRLTGKTSFEASWDGRVSESRTSGFTDTTSHNASLYAIWKVRPRIELGPGFRWGSRTGFDDAELEVMGPSLKLNYEFGAKVDFSSELGLNDTDSPSGDDDELLNWTVALKYRASARWGLDLAMIQDTQASLSTEGGFDEVTTFRLTHWRKIRRARLNLSLGYEDRESTANQAGGGMTRRDYDYLEARCAFLMPVYRDEAELEVSLAYRELDADLPGDSWDGWLFGVGIDWQF